MKKILFCLIVLTSYTLSAQVHDNPFAPNTDPNEAVTYKNPVIPGFYSDPSVCRVGEDYYLISSTFDYFPGVPIFHSKDLVNWDQIGHVIHREDQLPDGLNIFAATIRYHEGTFYMITTNVGAGGNFYVTATKPEGPWSDPIWVDVPAIDPDLFFDDDGKAYIISSPFQLYEVDIKSGKLLTEGKKVWHGTGGRWSEGPHIYKKDGFYYLMASEGGTEEAHSVTIARSNTIWGPYTDNPANPILAHANAAGQYKLIQGVGHADIVQAHDGSWWIAFHGYRKSIGYPVHHILGRETCMAPVSWPKNGWPVVNGNGAISANMTCPTLPQKPFPQKPSLDEFDAETFGLEWNFIKVPSQEDPFYKLADGTVQLNGLAQEVGEKGTSAFIGRRLQDLSFRAETSLKFDPKKDNEEAGLILLNNGQHFDIIVKRSGDQRVVLAKLKFGSVTYKSEEFVLKPGPVKLSIRAEDNNFIFSYAQDGDFADIESVDIRYLSTETVGFFTGVYTGMYATGKGKACKATAEFEYFEYVGE